MREEIAADTEMTLTETKPQDFDHDDWKALREAIKSMREKLDAMEEMIDRAETEMRLSPKAIRLAERAKRVSREAVARARADEYDEEAAEDCYETSWA